VVQASIISIGNEVLSGQTPDTNAAYLAERLLSVGIAVVSCYTVGDDVERIERALRLANEDAEIVLVTGGLGPTKDDVTREGLAAYLGVELRLDEQLLEKISRYFASRGRTMAATNKRQAYLPAGAKPLCNNLGTAPGILVENRGRLIAAMPGVPAEMRWMFEEFVLPKLAERAEGQAVVVKKLRCFGTGESDIAQMLGPLMERGRNPQINSTASQGIITLHIIAVATGDVEADRLAEADVKLLHDKLGSLVFGCGDESLAEVVGQKLAQMAKTVSLAESCTGGLIAKMLTDIPGASRYFTHGWVVYSNRAKTSELGVDAGLIAEHGAVSEAVALAMAEGARERAGTDYAVGVTGVAGPTGGTEQKPVGLVYIAVSAAGGCEAKRFIFPCDRESVRYRTAHTALNMLRLAL